MSSLPELQAEIASTRTERGFTSDPVQLLVLLAEEVGEIAREVKKTWSPNYGTFDSRSLTPELADAFVLIAALASVAEVDLDDAVQRKFFEADAQRDWPSAT